MLDRDTFIETVGKAAWDAVKQREAEIPPPPEAPTAELYLIASLGHTDREAEGILWWRSCSKGYSVKLEQAGRYSFEEASRICEGHEPDVVMIEESVVIAASWTIVSNHADTYRKMGIAAHAAKAHNWPKWAVESLT